MSFNKSSLSKIIFIFFVINNFSLISQDKNVFVALKGQLGNQLFQIAAGYSLARDNNANLFIPSLVSPEYNIPINRKFIFSNFNIGVDFFPKYIYQESSSHYDPIPFFNNMVLDGYFQSERYFINYKSEIKKLFSCPKEIKEKIIREYGWLLDSEHTVSMHVRFYVDQHPKSFNFLGWGYFIKAFEVLAKEKFFLIFSDDIERCKKRIPSFIKEKDLFFIESNDHLLEFYLMSMCKYNIISNSTFSWWSAYLNENPNKKVVSPSAKIWNGRRQRSTNLDIIPEEGWIQIE
jgi:hypothetical protein